ncbi:DUF58 domain-containing protein [Enterobacteriaceae bacterium BIT-l23]|uniref:DUF58 domain-containing protein n=1 Tax=Jejubacter sp. L23 TaxID=3092086 RepID=UPI0015851A8C|nr:DUF58 domain-containing protein [Enterobacteriaceae bacterium BIT-l23]
MNNALTVTLRDLMSLETEAHRLPSPPDWLAPGTPGGEKTSRRQGRGLNFESLRRYQPGDDVRLIDWGATARLRQPWIRSYAEECERPVFLILDQRSDMFFSTRRQTKSVAAAITAGLYAWRAWHDKDRLGCITFNDSQIAVRASQAPTRNLGPVFNDICSYNQRLAQQAPQDPDEDISLNRVLERALGLVPRGAWLALISDFHDLDAQGRSLLARLKRRCAISAFIMTDDVHLRLPDRGLFPVHYQGRRTRIALNPHLRQQIRQALIDHHAELRQGLERLGIRVRPLVTRRDLLDQLQQGGGDA